LCCKCYLKSAAFKPRRIDTYGPPALAIEISTSTLSDDLGKKRLLYERLKVKEYWVVDVKAAKIIAFEIIDGGSRQIQTSLVLPNLKMATIEEALERSKTEDDGTIKRWLLKHFG
ncbi:MAG: Uma2 family endonuclease, partial [Cyanobacteria bacterium P01_D01_bin.36]